MTFNESNHLLTMSTTTSGATIFYTSDGSTPTHSGGTATGSTQVYSGSFNTPTCADTTFKAIAYKSGMTDSTVTSYLSKHANDFGCVGDGMMMSAQSSTVTIFSVWDGDWAILEEYAPSNVLVEKYLQGYHGLVKTTVANVYYYQDELGSTSHIANASGALLEYYKYNLYGKPKFFSSTSQQLTASTYNVVDLGNGGARWIHSLGLYDDRNRFMSPDLGRFLQPDPIRFKGDASNLYRYCGNDWASRTDPMGLADETKQKNAVPDNSPWTEIEKDQLRSQVYAPTANSVERSGLSNTFNVGSGQTLKVEASGWLKGTSFSVGLLSPAPRQSSVANVNLWGASHIYNANTPTVTKAGLFGPVQVPALTRPVLNFPMAIREEDGMMHVSQSVDINTYFGTSATSAQRAKEMTNVQAVFNWINGDGARAASRVQGQRLSTTMDAETAVDQATRPSFNNFLGRRALQVDSPLGEHIEHE